MLKVGNMLLNMASIGIIGSYDRIESKNPFKDYLIKYLANGGGLVYICSNKNEIICKDYLKVAWEADIEGLIAKRKMKLVCGNDYMGNDGIDKDSLLKSIEEGIDEITQVGISTFQVYMTLDSWWNNMTLDNINYLCRKLKNMNNLKKTGLILKYKMDEFNSRYMNQFLKNHDYILVDRINTFECFTPDELIQESLSLLAEYHSVIDRYDREIIKDEYLKTLGELMEGTIHDINNLLVTILGYAQLSLSLDNPSEAKDYLKIINNIALDGKSITDRIKNYINGSYESLKGIYKFDYIIRNCIEMIRHKFKSSNIRGKGLKLKLDLSSNKFIYANEYDIRHTIINIILNGIEAMEDGGLMTIKTWDEKEYIILEITDTGVGMGEDIKNKIFEPHFTTKGSRGTGLGLAIAKKTCKKHNCQLYVDSELGKGTKFTIKLPALKIEDGPGTLVGYDYNIN